MLAYVFGAPGTGKSLALFRAFPKCVIIAYDGESARKTYEAAWPGSAYKPRIIHSPDIETMVEILNEDKFWANDMAAEDKVLIVDDFTSIAEQSASVMRETELKGDGRRAADRVQYMVLGKVVDNIARRKVKNLVVFNGHISNPVYKADGSLQIQGEPMLPGWNLPKRFTGYFEIRAVFGQVERSPFDRDWPVVLFASRSNEGEAVPYSVGIRHKPNTIAKALPTELRAFFEYCGINNIVWPQATSKAIQTFTEILNNTDSSKRQELEDAYEAALTALDEQDTVWSLNVQDYNIARRWYKVQTEEAVPKRREEY